jgi:hypothetical protein
VPSTLKSEFNHVCVAVTYDAPTSSYYVGVANKDSVPGALWCVKCH